MTSRPTPEDPELTTRGTAVENLAELDATNTLLDAIAARRATEGDPLASALIAWLDEIDAEYQPVHTDVLATFPTGPARTRSHRRRHLIMLATAVTVSVAAGTGVAAASPGSLLFPVHRALFGLAAPVNEPLDQASGLLDQVQEAITSAHGQPLAATQAATVRGQLGQALDALISASPSTRRTLLIARHDLLAGQLADLQGREATPAGPSARPTTPSASPSPIGQVSNAKPGESGQPNNGDSSSPTTGSSSGAGDTGATSGDNSKATDSPDVLANPSDSAANDSSGTSGSIDAPGGGSGSEGAPEDGAGLGAGLGVVNSATPERIDCC